MDAYPTTDDDEPHCDACLSQPALGLLTLHTDDGHYIASWCQGIAQRRAAPLTGSAGLTSAASTSARRRRMPWSRPSRSPVHDRAALRSA